jgi:hypothetical protein
MDRELIKLIEENGLTLHGDIEHFAHLVAEREREACAANVYNKERIMDKELIKLIEATIEQRDALLGYFAHLVAEREREACAAICDHSKLSARMCAIAIRARGGK